MRWRDRFIAWTLAFALAFFPTIASVRIASGLSPQIKATVLDYHAPAPSGGGGSFSLTAQGSAGSATIGTASINYGTVSYGTGCNAVLIGIWWYTTASFDTVTAVSVGGSPASKVSAGFLVGGANQVDLWQLNSPVGTSANITVTFSANVTFNSNVTLYCMVTTTTTVSAVANNGATATTCGTGTPVTMSLAIPSGGGALAFALNASGQVLTFTNATSDGVYTGGGVQDRWGHTTSTGTVSISATPAGTDTCTIAGASWGP